MAVVKDPTKGDLVDISGHKWTSKIDLHLSNLGESWYILCSVVLDLL